MVKNKGKNIREKLLGLTDEVFDRIDPYLLVHDYLENFDLSEYERIFVIGAGKCAIKMAKAVEKIVDVEEGYVVGVEGKKIDLKKIGFNFSSHPFPDERGVFGAKKVMAIAEKADEKDLVISLISGGGSAVLPLPVDGISLEEKVEITKKLISCGADIYEINAVRKHLSKIKGGNLAKVLYPASCLNLIISDVVGDDLSTIASGPLCFDPTTFEDARRILDKYGISVPQYIVCGKNETPKKGDKIFEKIQNVILANHKTVIENVKTLCEKNGISYEILDSNMTGDCAEASLRSFNGVKKKDVLYVFTGETTVNVRGDGFGGRNQEFVLNVLKLMKESGKNLIVLSIGTDGVDGICPEKVAGAIADFSSIKKELSIEDFLNRNDSYTYFKKVGGLIITGPTGTNLGDLGMIVEY